MKRSLERVQNSVDGNSLEQMMSRGRLLHDEFIGGLIAGGVNKMKAVLQLNTVPRKAKRELKYKLSNNSSELV